MLTGNVLYLKDLAMFHAHLSVNPPTFAPVSGPQLDLDPTSPGARRPAEAPRQAVGWPPISNRELVPGQHLGKKCPRSIRPRE